MHQFMYDNHSATHCGHCMPCMYRKAALIGNVDNTTYGNIYIKDEQGNELLIFGLYDSNGNKYGSMSSKPQIGDTIIVCGPIYYYNGDTVEIKNGTLISKI